MGQIRTRKTAPAIRPAVQQESENMVKARNTANRLKAMEIAKE